MLVKSVNNSTVNNISSNDEFLGEMDKVTDYASVVINVLCTGIVTVNAYAEFSNGGYFSIIKNLGSVVSDDTYEGIDLSKNFQIPIQGEYFRIRLKNTSINDTDSCSCEVYFSESEENINHNDNNILVYGNDGSNNYPLLTDSSGKLQTTTNTTLMVSNKGSLGNIKNSGSLDNGTFTSSLDVSKFCRSTIIYEDTSTGNSNYLTMYISDDDITYFETAIQLYPKVNNSGSKRVYTTHIDLIGMKYIKFFNESPSTLGNVYLSVIGGDF